MTDLIERILRKPRAVLAIMVILLIGGTYAYMTLPKESFPAIDIPYFTVTTTMTGVSPEDAEQLLSKPLEDQLKDLDGLKNITSTSAVGSSTVMLEFDTNTNKDKALSDVRAGVDAARPNLPTDATDPTIKTIDITGFATISVAVYGNVPERALVNHAKDLQDALKALPEVRDVSISGSRDEQMEVQLNLGKLDSYGLTASDLLDALAKNNIVVPAGTINTGHGAFNLQVPGLITTAADVYSLPIKTNGDTVVTFGDVATVTRTFKDPTEFTNVNGSPAIILGVTKKDGTNIIDVSDKVRATTTAFTKAWPKEIGHRFLLDQSKSTKDLFKSLEAAVLTAVALVMITCVATLGIRPALMIGTSIPISFMIAFLVVQLLGMTINMMIMFGLVLAVGVLVDDPIVVVEYAERKLAEGVPKREAFILAARKMFVPVVSATFTTLGAFVPLLFWPGIIGKFMSYLPIIVIVVMCASLMSALIFMPIIGGIIARAHIDPEEQADADVVMYPDKFDTKKVRGFSGVYVRMLARLIHYPIPTLLVGFGVIATCFAIYIHHPTGTEAFPASEPEYATVAVTGVGNYSPIQVRNLLETAEKQILQVKGIQDVVMQFGTEGATGTMPPNTIGNFELQLMPWSDRLPAKTIFANIRERVKNIAGLDIQPIAAENGPPAGKDINLRIESTDYANLTPTVTKIRNYIDTTLGGAIDVEDGRPAPGIDWHISVNRVAAAKYGIGVRELSPYVQLITGGVKIGKYRPEDVTDQLDIVARLPPDERNFAALDTMRIATPKGLVPVSNFITRKAVPKVASITRRNGVYVMNVAANLKPGLVTSDKIAKLKKWADQQVWPAGTHIVYAGAAEQISDTNTFIVKAMAGAMFIIFLVLLLEYNSFYQVFVTLSTVVMSLAGVLIGMEITGMAFSAIMTGLGIVALAGIVVKNGIVLIDTYNHYRRDDEVEPIKAMLITAAQRIRPVLLTATVTGLGVIPMALNVEFDFIHREITVGGIAGSWFVYLSAALVSGLFASTLLTLIMVPVMITAPHVIQGQLKAVGHRLAGVGAGLAGILRHRKPVAESEPAMTMDTSTGEAGKALAVAEDDSGPLDTERNRTTIGPRQAAE